MLGFSAPERILKKVLLPAPFGPITAVTRLLLNVAEMPLSATNAPKLLPMFSTERSGASVIFSTQIEQRSPDTFRQEQNEQNEDCSDE